MNSNYDLIQVFTNDDIKLTGLLKHGDSSKAAYIFIHGFTGDFFSQDFFHTIAKEVNAQGHAFLLLQTRGTGMHTEFLKRDNREQYIGSFYERIEEAHLDISAFISFLKDTGYAKIGLIGHSLGTIKAVRYLFEGEHKDSIEKLILLAPFDKNAFMERKAPGKLKEFLQVAEEKITAGLGTEIVPLPEYEDFPMSYITFVSWYNQSDLSCMWDFYRKQYTFPMLNKITVPVKVLLGDKDQFIEYPEFGVSAESALSIIKKHIKNCETVLLKDSGHTFDGFEDKVAREVVNFT